MYSIRDRLLWTFCIALLLAGVAATYMTFVSARGEVDRFLDTELQQIAISLSVHSDGQLPSMKSTGSDEQHIVVQLTNIQTRQTHLSSSLASPFPSPATAGFANIRHEGQTWRIYSLKTDQNLLIITAQPVDVRVKLAFSSALHILQPLVLLLPFLIVAVWLLVGQGLASLNRTAKIVSTRSSTSLEPLPVKALPVEVKQLVLALNDLLAKLAQSLEAQKRFASDAAHELRTPLTALKLQVQLAERAKTEESRQKAFNRLHAGIDRATGLVQQLLVIARLDPDAHKKPFVKVHLDQVIKSVADELMVLAQQKNITLETSASNIAVDGMEDALKLLVTNLTDNAIRYTQDNGRIRLCIREDNHSAVIEVSDNGPGIAPEERERIFDRFYRALGTKAQGHGLGLAIVKRIVEIHHGQIFVDDGLDGKGTTMQIKLPLRTLIH